MNEPRLPRGRWLRDGGLFWPVATQVFHSSHSQSAVRFVVVVCSSISIAMLLAGLRIYPGRICPERRCRSKRVKARRFGFCIIGFPAVGGGAYVRRIFRSSSGDPIQRKAIAVVAFADSATTQKGFFADGIQDDILTALAG